MANEEYVDILGVLPESDMEQNRGWTTILSGEESRRPQSLNKVAITTVEVDLKSEEDFNRFFEIIKESDRRLSEIPDKEVMYEWVKVRRKGLSIRFGVAWYDQQFFNARKDAYLSNEHSSMFKEFHITSDDLKITHTQL
ncbi:hypothetical protein GFK91_31440 (plasmid) [Roseibium aggregatum]|uniref:hypothetical protein n=1 Tax=Roseibium aggregatum TaxID=187304 RepID=UPI001E3459BF|nr:hypothetical protein [Roseibium aggregatum]UES60230.1 hypothetical protein GFK91_31440 [Roseibium aggregatum]